MGAEMRVRGREVVLLAPRMRNTKKSWQRIWPRRHGYRRGARTGGSVVGEAGTITWAGTSTSDNPFIQNLACRVDRHRQLELLILEFLSESPGEAEARNPPKRC